MDQNRNHKDLKDHKEKSLFFEVLEVFVVQLLVDWLRLAALHTFSVS